MTAIREWPSCRRGFPTDSALVGYYRSVIVMSPQQDQTAAAILIVDDHAPTLAAVRSLLSAAFPASRISTADSAERALELCAQDAPHVVVMDIVLPGIDGIEATRRIKSLLPETGVVMLSSHDLAIYRDAAAATGAGSFVTKSRAFWDLVPAVNSLLPAALRVLGGGR